MSRVGLGLSTMTAALLASTSLVHAIDPNASAALYKANQQAAAEAQDMEERITRMEGEIARMSEELVAVRQQKTKVQQELQASEDLNGNKSK
jgi:TolA-binding protein